jgi:hypothetical protein
MVRGKGPLGMKTFQCEYCGNQVFFENDRCVRCNSCVGYLPDARNMRAFTAPNEGGTETRIVFDGKEYQPCANWWQHKVCNWLVPVTDAQPFCESCRLNEVIPDLSVPGNLERWQKMELAKRRCLYTLQYLSLPFSGVAPNGATLRFRFLAESPSEPLVVTGHNNGLITVNISEADEDKRERRRLRLHEPYRTVVGHFRHELGHYYWDRLISFTPNLWPFRNLFGDESFDYGMALQNYYQWGPNAEAVKSTVTAYASAHPWEDWAETWAHYMHIVDMMETASAHGVGLENSKQLEMFGPLPRRTKKPLTSQTFDEVLTLWLPLTCALNTINRGMGLQDLYPFVLTAPVCEKLRFIHEVIQSLTAVKVSPEPTPTMGEYFKF